MSANTLDGGHLKAFIERIERLEEEKKALADDIKEVYAEAKGNGYDVKIMRKIVSIRKQDANKRREEEEILDLYLSALGESSDFHFCRTVFAATGRRGRIARARCRCLAAGSASRHADESQDRRHVPAPLPKPNCSSPTISATSASPTASSWRR